MNLTRGLPIGLDRNRWPPGSSEDLTIFLPTEWEERRVSCLQKWLWGENTLHGVPPHMLCGQEDDNSPTGGGQGAGGIFMEHLLFPEHSDSFHGPSNLIMKAAGAEAVVLFTAAREGTE